MKKKDSGIRRRERPHAHSGACVQRPRRALSTETLKGTRSRPLPRAERPLASRCSTVHWRIGSPDARRPDARRAWLAAVTARRPLGAAFTALASACQIAGPCFVHGRGTLLCVRVLVRVKGLRLVRVKTTPREWSSQSKRQGLRAHLGPEGLELRPREVGETVRVVIATGHPRQVWPCVPVRPERVRQAHGLQPGPSRVAPAQTHRELTLAHTN